MEKRTLPPAAAGDVAATRHLNAEHPPWPPPPDSTLCGLLYFSHGASSVALVLVGPHAVHRWEKQRSS